MRLCFIALQLQCTQSRRRKMTASERRKEESLCLSVKCACRVAVCWYSYFLAMLSTACLGSMSLMAHAHKTHVLLSVLFWSFMGAHRTLLRLFFLYFSSLPSIYHLFTVLLFVSTLVSNLQLPLWHPHLPFRFVVPHEILSLRLFLGFGLLFDNYISH